MIESLDESWKEKLKEEFTKKYFLDLNHFVEHAYQTNKIFPQKDLIFNTFNTTPFNDVRVVILGQDPYHGDGQAHGLSFSVNDGIKVPPSLVNIYKEINRDLGIMIPSSGNLTRWAKQGVLLLNSTLTVEAHKAGSHQNKGWETFTDEAIKLLAQEKEHLVFMLWGAYAQKKAKFIDKDKHLILESVHPSPLSAYRGFIGCNHFSLANKYLEEHGYASINW